jgi:hypothetical protein
MANTPIYTTAAGLGGTNYANVTIAGGSGITYTTATTDATWVSQPYYQKQPKVKITDSDIELDGLSLGESMKAIQNELMIPTRLNRNAKLEEEFAELKAAADHYYELEKKFLEQKKMWETLKKTDQ